MHFEPIFGRDLARAVACAAVALLAAAAPVHAQFVNDPASEPASAHQGYPSLAELDGIVVAAFADYRSGTNQRIRCSYSPDSGVTWIPLGVPPAPFGAHWVTDPRVIASPVHGRFFVFGGANDAPANGALFAFVPLMFPGGVPEWGTPGIVRGTYPGSSQTVLHGHDVAVSPTTGRLFAASVFSDGVTQGLDVQYSDDEGASWSPPIRQDSVGTCPLLRVHANRVYLMNGLGWPTYLSVAVASAPFTWTTRRVPRRNTAMTTGMAPTGVSSWFDLDDSDGRVYAAWAESYEYEDDPFPDPILEAVSASEVEPNETCGSATLAAVGKVLRGTVSVSGADLDHFRIYLEAGQRMIVWADSVAAGISSLDLAVAESLGTRPAWSAGRLQDGVKRTFVATKTDDYDFVVSAIFPGGVPKGYRLRTAPGVAGAEPARDQCDIVAAASYDEGATWSSPVRASTTATGVFDEGPVLEVGRDGRPQIGWWTRNPAFGVADARWRLMRSNDAGATWQMGGRLTSTSPGTDWTQFAGTFSGVNAMLALPDRIVHAFGELQATTPVNTDIRAAIQRTSLSVLGCGANYSAEPGGTVYPGALLQNDDAYFSETVSFTASTDRNWPLGPYEGTVPAGAARYVNFALSVPDTAASGPVELQYVVLHRGTGLVSCLGTIDVHSDAGVDDAGAVAFGLRQVGPNPAGRTVRLRYGLPRAARVTLDVLDLQGRRVARLADGLSAAGEHAAAWDGVAEGGGRVPAGVYLLELRAGGQRDVRRLVLLR